MFRVYAKDGKYYIVEIGKEPVEYTDYRYFSSDLKLRMEHESSLSKIHADSLEKTNQRNAELYANRRGRLPNENEFGTD